VELRHLRYFVAVAEQENFHRAAELLHVSQSPLSRQMRDLAAEIGVDLFEPAGRGVRLTAAGRVFADKAARVLTAVDAAVAEARLVAQGRIGTVSIGFETGTAYFGHLQRIVSTFRRSEPRITVRLEPMSSAQQWDALHTGQIALGYGFYPPADGSLACLEVARDRLGAVLPAGHRLAARTELTLADLRDEPVLLQPRAQYPRLHDDILTAARVRGITLDVAAGSIDLEALLTHVAAGDAITFLPEGHVRVLGLGPAVWRPVTDLDIETADVVMWRPEDADTPLMRPLLAIVREIRAAVIEVGPTARIE
jgi:DNA-binding transcriptional LysR family regulator